MNKMTEEKVYSLVNQPQWSPWLAISFLNARSFAYKDAPISCRCVWPYGVYIVG